MNSSSLSEGEHQFVIRAFRSPFKRLDPAAVPKLPVLRRSLILLVSAVIVTLSGNGRADELLRKSWTIDGVKREALVHLPKNSDNAPIVFFFHGRGGKVPQVSKQHPLQEYWPEAVVVFPQGLPTRALKGTGSNQVPGWQVAPKQDDDRDLKFFDAMLSTFKNEYKVNAKQVFVTGTSNGGGMTFLVWKERGDQLAAIAPTCTAARALATELTDQVFEKLAPLPSLHVVGDKDTTIPPEDQLRVIELLRKSRQCENGIPWGKPPVDGATYYPSNVAPVITYVYAGGHGLPSSVDSILVRFFKDHKPK